jgi:predicted branched-subunit amino acid permease
MTQAAPPDLKTKAGRKAWRHELRMVAVRPRRWGLGLLTLGFLLWVLPSALGIHAIFGWSPSLIGIVLMLAAFPLLIVAAVRRRRHARGRAGQGARPT